MLRAIRMAVVSTLAAAQLGCPGPKEGTPASPVSASQSALAAVPAQAVANGTDAVTLTAYARDAAGAPLAGMSARFAASGTGNLLSAASATTDASGLATVTLGSTKAEVKDASVMIDGVAVTQRATVTFVAASSFAIRGSVSGLTASGLVLSTPGQADLAVPPGATSFAFPDPVIAGTPYSVAVASAPAGLHCGVVSPRGIVGGGDVTTVAVWCTPAWAKVSAGTFHTVGLKTDGSIWAWGENASGAVGDGTTTRRRLPVQVGTGYADVAAGEGFTLAVKADGTLWAWGYNGAGQLGDGSDVNRPAPVKIGTATTWVSVAAGVGHSAAVRSDGTLWAWGWNGNGAVGDGTNVDRPTPV